MKATQKLSRNYNILFCSIIFGGVVSLPSFLSTLALSVQVAEERSKRNEKRVYKLEMEQAISDGKNDQSVNKLGMKLAVGRGKNDDQVEKIVKTSPDVEVVVSSSMFIPLVKDQLCPEIQVAAQNCWVKKSGVYTGELSAEKLVNLGFTMIIVGHAERRTFLGESNEIVADKVTHALAQGLKVIVCVGETLEQREAGTTLNVLTAQTKAISERVKDWSNVIIAYQPAWAFGSDEVDTPVTYPWVLKITRFFGIQVRNFETREVTPSHAQKMHASLRDWLRDNVSSDVAKSTRIIYGGPVTPTNCKDLAGQADIDGFLVGGASLKIVDIINAVTAKTA